MIEPKENLRDKPVYNTELFFNDEILKLDANENLIGASPRVLRAIKKLNPKKINFYPCYGEFLDELSRIFDLPRTCFLATNGCDEAINVIFSTYLEKYDNVVSFAPTFVMPKIYAEICNANFIKVDYDKKWEFDVEKIIEKASEKEGVGAKIIHLTSPNSPTGEMIKDEDIEKILKTFPDKIVLLDNTYINFCERNCNYTGLIKKYDNLFIAKSFSKDFALAGLRLGYIISNENNINNLKKVISPFSVNNLAILAGIESLRDKKYFEKMKKEIIQNKEILTKKLTGLGFKVYKSETNFILCDFGIKSDFIYEKLLKNNIVVKKFNDEDLKNCFRITIPSKKYLKSFIASLEKRALLVFDLDGVIFDVRNSYRRAIEKTYEHFCGKKLAAGEIQTAKNKGGLNCDWDLTKFLLEESGVIVKFEKIVDVFQEHFFNPQKRAESGKMGLIDEEKLIFDKKLIEKLSHKFDLCVFTGRPKSEAIYSLEKYGILKFFNLVVAKEDLPNDKQKPCPDGLEFIKEKCLYGKIYYFGDTSDDMKCASSASAIAIGVLPPQDNSSELSESLKKSGAKKVLKNINKIKDVI